MRGCDLTPGITLMGPPPGAGVNLAAGRDFVAPGAGWPGILSGGSNAGGAGPRVRAARACEFLGWLARPAVPELLEAAAGPDADLRFRVARALGRVNPRDPAAALDALRRGLADPDDRVARAAACALAWL